MNTAKKTGKTIALLNESLEYLVRHFFPAKTFIVFVTTTFTIILSMLLSFYLRFEFRFPAEEISSLERVLPVAVVLKLFVFSLFRIYSGLWRYVSIHDLIKIFFANLAASIALFVLVNTWHETYFEGFSRSVLVLDFLICFLGVSGKRVLARIIRESASNKEGSGLRTLLLGSSAAANSLIHAISATSGSRKIVGILSDELKPGTTIRGVRALGGISETGKAAAEKNVSEILLLPPYSTPKVIQDIVARLEEVSCTCELRMIPVYSDIADGNIDFSAIKRVEIEDLLGRKPVKLDNERIRGFVRDKSVMVTGAGGSIGSELCRQIASYNPSKLVLFELSEFNLYEIERKLKDLFPHLEMLPAIGDVRSEKILIETMQNAATEIVFHAAAYKHVPLMEANPAACIETNVFGTYSVLEACKKAGVGRMVMISTDKAVRPTSIMGASKRIAERIVLESQHDGVERVVVRFGNVLGSSGSVIPLFKQQLAEGKPLTVTSRDVVRYFMSIPEAVDLVLQAGAIGRDGDIMLLEMGEPVRIYDMARQLIELSGLVPEKDVEIKIIGLRPGEKEYEELLTSGEEAEKTSLDRIFVARKGKATAAPVNIHALMESVRKDPRSIKSILSSFIPENKFD